MCQNLLKLVCFAVLLFSTNLFAQVQYNVWLDNENLDAVLLKKDLAQAIKEAENLPSNDLQTLFRRLNLYYRAAHLPKISATLKQIIESPDFEKNRNGFADSLNYFLKDEIFRDARILQTYLRKTEYFHDGIYDKFVQLCAERRENCDVAGFDEWLARRAAESAEKKDEQAEQWLGIRIDFRKKMKLETAEILEEFAWDVRENPTDLKTALSYLKFFHTAAETEWLLQNFASKQAYDYLELADNLFHKVQYSQLENDERQRIARVGVSFLQKSLGLPFDEKDTTLIWQYKLSRAAVPVKLENPEKQLRFWTKTRLAEYYKIIGEAQNAQPLIEELAAMDKSDILEKDVNFLAGAVQAQSGARVVESKILREQATRQDSPEYWFERINYYRGRNEPERMFDAYKQMFSAVAFNINERGGRENRIFNLRRFADFVHWEFGRYVRDEDDGADLSEEQRRKLAIFKDAESFLKTEFEKNSANLQYSYELLGILEDSEFDGLLDELLSKNSKLLVNAFINLPVENSFSDVFYSFLKSETVPKQSKDAFVNQLEKIVLKSNPKKAIFFAQMISGEKELKEYTPRAVPILLKTIGKTESEIARETRSGEKLAELKEIRKDSLTILFSAYLTMDDWRSAENLLMTKCHYEISERLGWLANSAARNNAFGDALRIWKIRANLNRRDLNNLSYLNSFPAMKAGLREFYAEMKQNEAYSPIPEKALQILK